MRWPGIEPGATAWQAAILPLNHQRYDEGKSGVAVAGQSQSTEHNRWIDAHLLAPEESAFWGAFFQSKN
jgi:hypothetical protein